MPILTEEGKKLIEALIRSYSELIVTMKVPFQAQLFGFPVLQINDREELFGRIQILGDLIGYAEREKKEQAPVEVKKEDLNGKTNL
jgi:hypothetical protein